MDKPNKHVELEIEVEPQVAQGLYTNLAGVAHNESEFILDFLFLQPNQPKAKVHSRIISSPIHMKRFMKALADNLRLYEEKYGEIVERSGIPQAHS